MNPIQIEYKMIDWFGDCKCGSQRFTYTRIDYDQGQKRDAPTLVICAECGEGYVDASCSSTLPPKLPLEWNFWDEPQERYGVAAREALRRLLDYGGDFAEMDLLTDPRA